MCSLGHGWGTRGAHSLYSYEIVLCVVGPLFLVLYRLGRGFSARVKASGEAERRNPRVTKTNAPLDEVRIGRPPSRLSPPVPPQDAPTAALRIKEHQAQRSKVVCYGHHSTPPTSLTSYIPSPPGALEGGRLLRSCARTKQFNVVLRTDLFFLFAPGSFRYQSLPRKVSAWWTTFH